jgi:hypothetical protein
MRRTVGALVTPRAAGRARAAFTTFSFSSLARRAPLRRGTPARGPPLVVA